MPLLVAQFPTLNTDGIVLFPLLLNKHFILRKHRFDSLQLSDFDFLQNTYNQIKNIIKQKEPFLIAGATGTGKTLFS